MEPDFSVIIPVYNAESSIVRCMESLKKQNGYSFEVLVIDDGSTDSSGRICDRFAAENSEFRVYHRKNQGPSSARNFGLQLARGKYIAFVDSDDFVADNYFEKIENGFRQSDSDILFIGYTDCFVDGKMGLSHVPKQYSSDFYEMVAKLSENDLFGYTWSKVFRRTVIQNCKFHEELDLFEDEIFICDVLNGCHSIAVVEYPIYFYVRSNRTNLTGKVRQDYCNLQDYVYVSWSNLFAKYKDREEILEKKANTFVVASQYYLYERNVRVNQFLETLQKCLFFQQSTLKNSFCDAVRAKEYYKVHIMRRKYKLKLVIHQLLSRKEE